MTLKQWSDNGWLRPHKATTEEIENLFQIVDRDLKDARSGVSPDWRFSIAYNAALKLCTILLNAEGYKAERNLQHYRTIQALPKILGSEKSDDADYLDTCRVFSHRIKLVAILSTLAGGETFVLPASITFINQAIFLPSTFIICLPSASCSISPGSLPWATVQ